MKNTIFPQVQQMVPTQKQQPLAAYKKIDEQSFENSLCNNQQQQSQSKQISDAKWTQLQQIFEKQKQSKIKYAIEQQLYDSQIEEIFQGRINGANQFQFADNINQLVVQWSDQCTQTENQQIQLPIPQTDPFISKQIELLTKQYKRPCSTLDNCLPAFNQCKFFVDSFCRSAKIHSQTIFRHCYEIQSFVKNYIRSNLAALLNQFCNLFKDFAVEEIEKCINSGSIDSVVFCFKTYLISYWNRKFEAKFLPVFCSKCKDYPEIDRLIPYSGNITTTVFANFEVKSSSVAFMLVCMALDLLNYTITEQVARMASNFPLDKSDPDVQMFYTGTNAKFRWFPPMAPFAAADGGCIKIIVQNIE